MGEDGIRPPDYARGLSSVLPGYLYGRYQDTINRRQEHHKSQAELMTLTTSGFPWAFSGERRITVSEA